MVRQHIYRMDALGGRTVAASAGMKDSAWLSLLEQQLSLNTPTGLSVPVYYQYPLGRGLVLSCCAPDPSGEESGYIAHQLVLDESADIETLMRIRPVSRSIFRMDGSAEEMSEPEADSLGGGEEIGACFEALDALFGGEEELLSRFISALSLCARDKRMSMRVIMPGEAGEVSENARRLMELMLRCMDEDDAVRVSFCTLRAPGALDAQYSVCFETARDAEAGEAQGILLNLVNRSMFMPMGAALPGDGRQDEQARALLEHDLEAAVRSGSGVKAGRSGRRSRSAARPFEKGMSLKKYFSEWREELEKRRPELTEEGFRALAAGEWASLLEAVVSASEWMDNAQFLKELNGILTTIRREKLETALCLDGETMTDMIVLMLDGIRWRQVDLAQPQTARLIRTAAAYAQVLNEEQCAADCLAACRVFYRLLTAPTFIQESLMDMAMLEEKYPARFEEAQDCLRRYVQNRLSADIDVIDEMLAAAAMLGFAKFSGGVPDLRLADKLTERIETQSGPRAARRFQSMMDKLRRHLHSTRPGTLRRRDMKLLLSISMMLLALIVGITVWFLLLSGYNIF